MAVGKLTGQFARLRSCACFPEVRARLLSGVSPTRIALYIHECGEYKDLGYRSLAAQLCAYRRTLSAAELVAVREPGFVADAKKEINDGLDELAELAEIYNVQKARIIQGRKLEEKLGVLNKTLGNEVRIAGEMLRTHAAIKQQIGLVADIDTRNPGPGMMLDTRSRYGERVARVIEDPGRRNRVLNAVGSILAAADAKAKVSSD
jgi:hypothetical protein